MGVLPRWALPGNRQADRPERRCETETQASSSDPQPKGERITDTQTSEHAGNTHDSADWMSGVQSRSFRRVTEARS